ncbi:YheU family protein [Marinicellulosiphila megalodicopiae]|uniref:YheU family protein n=1 Tax=Marinicellulosiphila megalodicopiae TaxID=2724896 RepID=UPI003BB13D03
MMIIPFRQLSEEALDNLLVEYVTRDSDASEISIETKKGQVLQQLKNGQASIVFDSQTQSSTIISVDELV